MPKAHRKLFAVVAVVASGFRERVNVIYRAFFSRRVVAAASNLLACQQPPCHGKEGARRLLTCVPLRAVKGDLSRTLTHIHQICGTDDDDLCCVRARPGAHAMLF